MEQHLRADRPVVARRRRFKPAPYLLALPGVVWLAVFFVIPIVMTLSVSLQTGNVEQGFQFTWHFANYSDALRLYHVQFVRSIIYGVIVTGATFVLGYPMAYWIAFHGGRRKSFYLFLLLLPFFVSFVIRTVAWQFILSDNGILLGPLKDLHLLPSSFHVLATSLAVIGGLTYNFLPFMVLPLYVSLERIDPELVEAANDLYASRMRAFLRVVFPLSIPGVFAGVLLTFVPSAADYVNASILGGTSTTMIGNIIQTLYLTNNDYPLASALSFVLMAVLIAGVIIYARVLGTERVYEVAAG
ncbi:MAG TPA: ABC transporter permease [Actinomycetes bacterium]